MTRKPLPKAITQPIGNPRAAKFDALEPEPALAVSAAPIANDIAPAARVLNGSLMAKRRRLAERIVARHKNYAALGGLVPVPVANIASVTAINLRMVRQVSQLYDVPFPADRAGAFIVGLIGGAVPTGVGTATSTTLMWIVPGGLIVGLGAAALTAGALTRGIGMVFIESFEGGS